MIRMDTSNGGPPYREPTLNSEQAPARRTYRELRKRVRKHWRRAAVTLFVSASVGSYLHHCVPEAIENESRARERIKAHERDCEQFRDTPQRDIPGRCLSYYAPHR